MRSDNQAGPPGQSATLPIVRLNPGQILMRAGDEAGNAYLVLEGALEAYLDGPDGDEHLLGRIGPGQIAGEMALIDRSRRSAHVRAAADGGAVCAPISDMAMQRLMSDADPVLRALLLAFGRRLRAANAQAAIAGNLPPPAATGPLSGHTVLGITADTEAAQAIAAAAGRLGARCILESSGLKALNAVQAGLSPALILGDTVSNDMTGVMLARLLAIGAKKGPRAPFLLLGPRDGRAVAVNPREIDYLIDPPFAAESLAAAMRQKLRLPRAA